MDKYDLHRVQQLFEAARELSPERRQKHLEEHIANDSGLLKVVLDLLSHHDAEDQQLDHPVLALEVTHSSSEFSKSPGLHRGATIGRYRIIEKMGEGGMGIVFLAEQSDPQRRVALKIIRQEVASEELLRRFRFEADVLARLQHPGIAHVYESGVAELEGPLGPTHRPYIAMELIEGQELEAHTSTLGQRETLRLFAEICDAVEHAHQSGIIHRDLKPGNILVDRSGRPKVLDFGVARAITPDLNAATLQTQVGQIVGTLPYMSPEQINGQPQEIDHRCDIYALGVILYKLLTGRLPLDMRNCSLADATRMVADEDPAQLSSIDTRFRGDLTTITAKALEKEKERRYSSATALAADVRRHLLDEPIAAQAASSWYLLQKFARRNRGLVAGMATAMMIFLVGSLVATTLAVKNSRLATQAIESETNAKRTTYRTSLVASIAALSVNDFNGIQKSLVVAPAELRNWEWYYLKSASDDRLASYSSSATSTARFTENDVALAPIQRDQVIDIVELQSGHIRCTITPAMPYDTLSLSRDCSRCVGYSRTRGQATVWETANGVVVDHFSVEAIDSPRKHLAGNVCLNDDGSLLAVDAGPLIEVDTGKVRGSVSGRAVGFRGDTLLEWSPFGRWKSGTMPGLKLTDTRSTPRLLAERSFPPGKANGIAWAPSGRIAVRPQFGLTSILDAQLNVIDAFPTPFEGEVSLLDFIDEHTLIGASRDGGIRSWDLRTGQSSGSLAVTTHATQAAISSDQTQLAIASPDSVTLFSRQDLRGKVLRGHTSFVYCTAFSPDGRLIASAGWDSKVCLWNSASGTQLAQLEILERSQEPGRARALSFAEDGQSLLYATERSLPVKSQFSVPLRRMRAFTEKSCNPSLRDQDSGGTCRASASVALSTVSARFWATGRVE